ncbi:hypothetical protein Tco_0047566 [Tanacetum coccineum]
MSSLCLVMNRVGSIEPFENPSDTRKLESSSYHALGACLRPYNAFLRRDSSMQNHAHGLPLKFLWLGSTHGGVAKHTHLAILVLADVLF